MTLDSLIDIAGAELVSVDIVPPFRLFRLIRFRNLPAQGHAESYRMTAPPGVVAHQAEPSLDSARR